MNKTLLIFLVILVVGGLVYWLVMMSSGQNKGMTKLQETGTDVSEEQTTQDKNETGKVRTVEEITYGDEGFAPQTLTVQVGTTVTWMNESSGEMWPATTAHPTHTVYPGSSISKCGTAEEETTFDACRGIAPGGDYAFTFNEVGDWKYHDHLNPTRFGSVVVD